MTRLMSKHTELPWRVSETWSPPVGSLGPNDEVRDGKVFWGYSISGSDKHGAHILPTIGAIHNFPDQIHANAEFIVRAVNNHYALIEALDDMVKMAVQRDDLTEMDWGEIDKARAALKAAQGET